MSENSTRISDLPENITYQPVQNESDNTQYRAINNHPNPYGHPSPNGGQIPLPSRDIPMNTQDYSQDEHTQPNYIPKPKLTMDFVKEYEDDTESLGEHKKKTQRKKFLDSIEDEFRLPLFLTLLFLVFQLPIVGTLLHKYLGSLTFLWKEDGNMTLTGLVMKSVLFGTSFYGLTKMADYF
jgi:hypothetical protein